MDHHHDDGMNMDMGSGSGSESSSSSDMDMSMGMGMDGHPMSESHSVFHDTHTTSLYSFQWTPTNTGTYAGTCIFLIFLAVVFRGLLASKTLFKERMERKSNRRKRYIVTADETAEKSADSAERGGSDTDGGMMGTLVTGQGKEETVRVVQQSSVPSREPWRLSTDVPRALLVTVIVGVGYLLMLAVMSMNVGYFLSVLGGVFLGDLAMGRFIHVWEEH